MLLYIILKVMKHSRILCLNALWTKLEHPGIGIFIEVETIYGILDSLQSQM